MGKPEKTRGGPFWNGKAFRLTDAQRQRLTEDLLGIDADTRKNIEKARKAAQYIELILGGYEGAVQSIDQAPRPANYLAELEGIEKNPDGTNKDGLRRQAYDLMNSLAEMSYWMKDEFKEQEYDVYDLARECAKFVEAGAKISKKYDRQESRGKPASKAFKMLVNSLREAFSLFYSTPEFEDNEPEADRRMRGGKAEAEMLFIKECLDFSSIPRPKTDDSIRRLFYNDNDPSEERLYFSVRR